MKLREKLQKVGEQMVNMLFNKVLGENERCLFFFLTSTKEVFGQMDTSGFCKFDSFRYFV